MRALRAVGVVLVFIGLSGTPTAGAVGESFGGYQATASGLGFRAAPVLPSLLPAEAPFEGTLSLTEANLSSGGRGFGRASTVWPGSLFVGIRPLIEIATGTRLPLPDYPLVVEQREFEDAKHSEQPGITMATDVKPEHAIARAEDGGVAIPAVVNIGSIRTVSDVLLQAKKISSIATSTVHGVDVGPLHIESIESIAQAATDGTASTCSGGVTVSGASVAGTPVTIDDTGVHVQGESVLPGISLDDVVAGVLQTSGIEVRTLRGSDSCTTAIGSRTSGGVLISAPIPAIPPIPPDGKLLILLGSTTATAGASPPVNLRPVPTTTTTPGISQIVTHAPGPASGGLFVSPFQPSVSESPPAEGARTVPVEPISYSFDGVPIALVIGLLLAAVPGSRTIRRYMQRLFAAVASP